MAAEANNNAQDNDVNMDSGGGGGGGGMGMNQGHGQAQMQQMGQQQGMYDQPKGGDNGLLKGTVKRFNAQKGFGFITCDDGSGDVFVHFSEVKAQGFKTLGEGEKVEFNVVIQDDGRRKATNVTGPDGAYVIGDQGGGGYGGGYGGGNRGGYGGGYGGGGYGGNYGGG